MKYVSYGKRVDGKPNPISIAEWESLQLQAGSVYEMVFAVRTNEYLNLTDPKEEVERILEEVLDSFPGAEIVHYRTQPAGGTWAFLLPIIKPDSHTEIELVIQAKVTDSVAGAIGTGSIIFMGLLVAAITAAGVSIIRGLKALGELPIEVVEEVTKQAGFIKSAITVTILGVVMIRYDDVVKPIIKKLGGGS